MSLLAKLAGRPVVSREPKERVRKGMKNSKPGATANEKISITYAYGVK